MLLICHTPFGYDKPGDSVEVPDGAEYDHAYYHEDESVPQVISNPPAADAGEDE